jgi:hypothetical protein
MATNNKQVLQLKISIVGMRPPIWRSILIPADSVFFDLHVAIQDAFGWEDSHLHQFFTANPFARNSTYRRISYPMPMDIEMDDNPLDERKEKLMQWYKTPKEKVWYEYDFGDSWMHEITLEKIVPKEVGTKYPQLLDGARACPKEDSGGIGGYAHLCDVLANPKHQEHKDMLEWLELENPDEFNPEYFDSTKVRFQDPKRVLQWYAKQFN